MTAVTEMITQRRAEGLQRFIDAQAETHHDAIRELTAGHKLTHWMWWTFPQEPREGTSVTSRIYALDLAEAREYARHELLGQRLRELTEIVDGHLQDGEQPVEIFGPIDALKFRSCMQLFASATNDPLFMRVAALLD